MIPIFPVVLSIRGLQGAIMCQLTVALKFYCSNSMLKDIGILSHSHLSHGRLYTPLGPIRIPTTIQETGNRTRYRALAFI
jgi:hypothetical protein